MTTLRNQRTVIVLPVETNQGSKMGWPTILVCVGLRSFPGQTTSGLKLIKSRLCTVSDGYRFLGVITLRSI